jgi:acylphosphatase
MTEAAGHEQWQIYYEGRVQGVGFRYTTRWIASRLPVTGYVRNLPDGRVLMVAEGLPDQLQRLVDAVAAEMGRHVRRTTRNAAAATGEFDGFEIRF